MGKLNISFNLIISEAKKHEFYITGIATNRNLNLNVHCEGALIKRMRYFTIWRVGKRMRID